MFRWVNNNDGNKNKSSRNKNVGLSDSISLVWSCFVYFDSLKSTGWQQRATWLLVRPEWRRRIFLQLSRSFEITKSSVLLCFQVLAQRDASCVHSALNINESSFWGWQWRAPVWENRIFTFTFDHLEFYQTFSDLFSDAGVKNQLGLILFFF